MDYIAANTRFYRNSFDAGYGHHHPESHIIKLYHRVLKSRLGLSGAQGERLLDFGCSTGINAVFFARHGFEVYGVDISETAIAECRRVVPEQADHFEVIDPHPQTGGAYFGGNFDVVLSNQVLALFSEEHFRQVLERLRLTLRPGGILIASMAGTPHYYYGRSRPADGGLRRVTPGDDPEQVLYMRFWDSEAQLRRDFEPFEPLMVGYYDINLQDDSGFHYVLVGRRA